MTLKPQKPFIFKFIEILGRWKIKLDISSKKVVSCIEGKNGYIRKSKTTGIIPTGV